MDSNNGQVPKPDQVIGGEAVPTGDWRTQLPQGSRERIVNKITETLKRHLPFSGQEGLQELKKIAVRFEEKIYTAATSQSDYLRKISLKMLTMETKSKNPMPNSLQSNAASNSKNPQDPASQSMQSQMQSLVQQLPIPMVPNWQQILSQNIPNNIPSTGVPNSAGLTPAMPPIGGMPQGTMHQQQSTVQQNNLPNMHQQKSGGQTNQTGVLQQQMGGIQHGNSNLQTNPQAVHKLQQSKVVAQQLMQQKLAMMFSNQAQPSQSQPMQQQLKSQIQSQPGQLENQLGLQQQSNTCADSSSPMGSATPVDWPKEYRKMLEQRKVLQQQYMLRLQQQQQQYMQPSIQLPLQQQSLIQQSLNHQLQQQQQQVYMHLIWQQQQVMLQQQQKLMLQKPLIQQQQQQQPMLQKPVIQLQQQTSKQPSIQQQQQTSKQLPIQQQQTSKQQNMLKQPLIQQDELFERLPGQKMMPTSVYVLIICVMLLFMLMMLHCAGFVELVR